ncbi:MAG: DUF839 domain-containing protein [Gammaproteobacteria bacterium]|nr:DUF839 domain-containing protein [Gammaproteobacteria bacterium]
MGFSRRSILAVGAAAGALPSLRGLWARESAAPGAIAPVVDGTTGLPLLRLPAGFSYRSFSWTGDAMTGGGATPARHDGMAAFAAPGGGVTLVRNHELSIGTRFGGTATSPYDVFELPPGTEGAPDGFPGFAGGVTAVSYAPGRPPETVALLSGTAVNCAGGPTAWGSWLTCEEIVLRASRVGAKDHGYVFEVPATGGASGRPIVDMGFFRHEAVALDPTGIVYLTEDNGPYSGFYRYLPSNTQPKAGALEEGGRLEALRVRGVANADLRAPAFGDEHEVDWVPVPEPDADPEGFAPEAFGGNVAGTGKSGPYLQAEAAGAARFARGEGAWEHGGSIYWVDTSAGAAGAGAVWVYEPGKSLLRALYVSPAEAVADAPDNITVHDNGLVLACEDGGGLQNAAGELVRGTRLLALGRDGRAVEVGENNIVLDTPVPGRPAIEPADYRGSEWAGATFSPDGTTLFVNIQSPGITLAITGPWEALAA